ncbi:MAG TPA: hypothetical protein VGS97_04000 [Actinocrinis sp.]|uniref:hypothetical protein n=1 Tax=Actinocrinis sp. TaxID=1920516 RepID=UPI002DDD6FE5|nr:hypothetical protein [Actinocrinis sp.]HEV2343231.1 hypothetical protein [Actinocrinis sp.]
MRTSFGGRRRLTFLLAALVTTLLGFAAAAPASAAKTIPGDNGDVKIHAVGTFFVDHRNQPHVCRFYLDAFNFDPVQQITWLIRQQPPTGHAEVKSGSMTLSNGAGHSVVMSLPAGHYKLVWNFTGEHGEAKFKVFWSDCAAIPSPPPGSVVQTGGGTTIGTVNSSGQAISPSGTVVTPSLAETGVSLGPWAAAGAGLLLAGGLLVRRVSRRRMQ